MNVLVIGGGGREHALVWAIARSPKRGRLYCAPGNAGIARHAECVALCADDAAAVIAFCQDKDIALVVIGPEAPLVAGLADDLRGAGIDVFGPGRAAAQLEGSKRFTKELCAAHGIPTAAYAAFTDAEAAKAYLRGRRLPIVVKADGLAAGKGVVIAQTLAEAEQAIQAILGGQFGAAGAELVIEDFMAGEEASLFAVTDGDTVLPLAGAQDHKRVGDGDTGPNTGGMGAYSPAPVFTDALLDRAMAEIVRPTLAALKARGIAYQGVLYAGLMLTAEGPKLVEYNVRFGDPEAQVILARLTSDALVLLHAAATGGLAGVTLDWDPRTALTVVMAAEGYPGAYRKGSEIRGLAQAEADGTLIFHAGTKADGARLLANGGRVLNVTALGEGVAAAQAAAYRAVDRIDWPDGFCRRDIGAKAL